MAHGFPIRHRNMRKIVMSTASGPKRSFAAEAEKTAGDERAIQKEIDRKDAEKEKKAESDLRPCRRARGAVPAVRRAAPGEARVARGRARASADVRAPDYKGSEKLRDKVALITGGDSGIGRAVAVLFAREGADVAIVYLDEHEDAEDTKRAVEKEGRRCILIAGDVADPRILRGGGRGDGQDSSAGSTSSSTTPRSRST